MKNKKGVVVFFLIIMYLISLKEVKVFAQESFYPVSNVVTVQGEPVQLPKKVTYLGANNQVLQDTVKWPKVDEKLTERIGTHQLEGRAEKTGQKVKGLVTVYPKTKAITIAAVGDSITYGARIDNKSQTAYPKQLNNRLGKQYNVINFGVSAKTLLETGDDPYFRTAQYRDSLRSKPDIVVIQLGTNDTRSANFRKKDKFITDYISLINVYKNLPTKPIIYICLPPKLFAADGVVQSRLETYLPMMMQAAEQAGADVSVIDNQSITENAEALFPDTIHPNAKGAALLANNVYHSLKGETASVSKLVPAIEYDRTYGAINAVEDDQFYLTNIGTNNWVSYGKVDLSQTQGVIQLTASVYYDDTKVTVREGSPTGEILGKATLFTTKNWDEWYSNSILIEKTQGIKDIYLTFERSNTSADLELVRLGNVDFNYDRAKPFKVFSEIDLRTAIENKRANIELMADVHLTKNIQLSEDTLICLNQHTLNTDNYSLVKNKAISQKIKVTIEHGKVLGNNLRGSIYSATSENADKGLILTIKDVQFSGTSFVQNSGKGAAVIFTGKNVISGRNIKAKNIIVKENAAVTLYLRNEYSLHSIAGFSKWTIEEFAERNNSSKQLTVKNSADEMQIFIEKNAVFSVNASKASAGFSYNYGAGNLFDLSVPLNTLNSKKEFYIPSFT
ncbi:GDSL-type esterase/lipase family protein [Enterococcus sp. UD-01]|jgi:lysophospholipase L1-like esterase|uniref:GDSL-type esterase/lipase family protein n=1 Tax=Enterococcus sp. UD-01 TaxID=3373911 RepID=UPI00383848A4